VSGWIKFEKDLESDPRVLRMAKQLDRRFYLFGVNAELDPCNACAFPGVTLVCGTLTRLWCFADSHIRDDDTLDMSAAELNEHLGLPGFCEMMPDDWLVIVDEKTIELPGFQEHNGVEAKKRALTQKRVSLHRKRQSVTQRNASTLPDQTRPDQKRPDQREDKNASATRAANGHAAEEFEFSELQAIYPKRGGDQRWHDARKAINARLTEGHTWPQILNGAQRYAAWCVETGKVGTETVKQAATFVGPGKAFLEPWTPPLTKADVRLGANLSAADEFMRRTERTQ
jgi:hypothetical protein